MIRPIRGTLLALVATTIEDRALRLNGLNFCRPGGSVALEMLDANKGDFGKPRGAALVLRKPSACVDAYPDVQEHTVCVIVAV